MLALLAVPAAIGAGGTGLAAAAEARPRAVSLWPFFEYASDPVAATRHLRILGPLIEYRADADRQSFFFRPFVSSERSRVADADEIEQITTGLGGLVSYRTRTAADGRTLVAQRARLVPIYFYDWERPDPSGRLSVAPFYADVEDVLGFTRVRTVMFPAFVHVERPPLDRRYYLFPLLSADGDAPENYRLWPFPLRDRHGRPVASRATPVTPPSADAFLD